MVRTIITSLTAVAIAAGDNESNPMSDAQWRMPLRFMLRSIPEVAAGVAAAAGEVLGLELLLELAEVAAGVAAAALGLGLGLALWATGAAEVAGTTGGAGLLVAGRMVVGDAPDDEEVVLCTTVATAVAGTMTGCCCWMRQDCTDG